MRPHKRHTTVTPSLTGMYDYTRWIRALTFYLIIQIIIYLTPLHLSLFTCSTKTCILAKACLGKKKKKRLNIKIAEIRTCGTDIMRLSKLH